MQATYVVIFKARLKQNVTGCYEYFGRWLREKAQSEYGCLDFIAVGDGQTELAISYWKTRADIYRWRHDVWHQRAQKLGKSLWYESYDVTIAAL